LKRHALESLGFSSREIVQDYINEMYHSNKVEEVASALFAMGRSADNRYRKIVITNLHNPSMLIQLEAIRAAGELDIKDVREDLLEFLDDTELDEEVYYATIWALSQIGGPGVKDKFDEIMDSEIDDELADFVENAMDNLAFNDGLSDFDLLDLDEKHD
jgi:HEAT repeat protein